MSNRQRISETQDRTICPVCGREILSHERSVERYDGKLMHIECATKNFSECSDCLKWYPKGYVTEVSGEQFCEKHLENNTVICRECGDRILRSNARYLGNYDSYVCDSCYDNYYSECEYCGEVFEIDEMFSTVSDGYVCENCRREHYVTCNDCELEVPISDSYCRDDTYYCENCDPGPSSRDGVIPYHNFGRGRYVPRSCNNDNDELYFGVELECERGEFEIDDFSYWTCDDSESPLVHFEEDGSLDDEGVEAITQPLTLRYHQELMCWKDFCSRLENQGFKSHNTKNCGLHVHISREALNPSTIVKMDVFINRAKDFFSVIARRESFYGYNGKYDKNKIANKYKGMECGEHRERYTAVNTTNRDTVEIRIFRGTLRYETILGTIEILHGLVNFLDNLPIVKIYETEKNVVKFIDYLAENYNKYPHVFPMMRRLFVAPRNFRKDYVKRIGRWYGQLVNRTADENEI